jgi:hypothetical protein
VCAAIASAALLVGRGGLRVSAAASDVVLYGSDVTNIQGNWAQWSGGDAAGGQYMASVDYGWSSTSNALASPGDYFEAQFNAASSTPYHVWLRLRAGSNSKWNDSVWVQFSDAFLDGEPIYPMNSTSGLLVNLATDFGAASLNRWGWQNGAYWLSQPATVTFDDNPTHTLRIQLREDGVTFDQIVLSPVTYATTAPGPVGGDNTIVPK